MATAAKEAKNREYNRTKRENLREIGEPQFPPDVKPPTEQEFEEGRNSLKAFALACFKEEFYLDLSSAHETAFSRMEAAVLTGGRFALAMPRGSGKSTIARVAVLWAILYGHRKYAAIVGAEATHAHDMIESLKTHLESNAMLLAYFPDAVWPVRCLDGVTQRAASQLFRGERTHMNWSSGQLVMPTVKDSPSSGSVVSACGILGKIRGQFHTNRDGQTIRPDFVVVDDPQTDESANSTGQVDKREKVVKKSILYLGGPDVKIAGVALVTVIQTDDLASRLLDPEANPEWDGQRTKMLEAMPERMDIWEGQYDTLRQIGLREKRGLKEATEFYLDNREEMDRGAVPSWEERFYDDEVSAVQHAMNKYLEDKYAFFSEMQNEPKEDEGSVGIMMQTVYDRIGPWEVGAAPATTEHVTAFVDVQQRLLYWMVFGWRQGFSGNLMAYGSWPPQDDYYFSYENARKTFETHYKGGADAQLRQALGDMVNKLYTGWDIEDGATMAPDIIMIDAGFKSRVVREFIRDAKLNVLKFSYGKGITAANLPINEGYKRKGGEIVGAEWRQSWTTDPPKQRQVLFDANHWKTQLADRLNTENGDAGSIEIFNGDPLFHRMLAEQLSSEIAVETEGRGRKVHQWKLKVGRADNHLLDCAVGNCVAASILGIKVKEDLPAKKKVRRRFKPPGRG